MLGPPRVVDDCSMIDWLINALNTNSSSVDALLPGGYSAYVRLENPAGVTLGENGLAYETLVELSKHLSPTGRLPCVFAYWIGHSWVHGGGLVVAPLRSLDGRTVDTEQLREWEAWSSVPVFAEPVLSKPALKLPNRDYIVMRGSVASAIAFGRANRTHVSGRFCHYSPDMLWAEDRVWFVATDVDLESTYLGGNDDLIAVVLADDRLNATLVSYKDELLT